MSSLQAQSRSNFTAVSLASEETRPFPLRRRRNGAHSTGPLLLLGPEELARVAAVQAAVGAPAANTVIGDLRRRKLAVLHQFQPSPTIQALFDDPAVLVVVRKLSLAEIARAVHTKEEAPELHPRAVVDVR